MRLKTYPCRVSDIAKDHRSFCSPHEAACPYIYAPQSSKITPTCSLRVIGHESFILEAGPKQFNNNLRLTSSFFELESINEGTIMELIIIQTRVCMFISHNCLFVCDLSLFSSLSGYINISIIFSKNACYCTAFFFLKKILRALPQNYWNIQNNKFFIVIPYVADHR